MMQPQFGITLCYYVRGTRRRLHLLVIIPCLLRIVQRKTGQFYVEMARRRELEKTC